MGRKKIVIERITDERNRQVRRKRSKERFFFFFFFSFSKPRRKSFDLD